MNRRPSTRRIVDMLGGIGETELRESDIWRVRNEYAECQFNTWILLPENFVGFFAELQIEPT